MLNDFIGQRAPSYKDQFALKNKTLDFFFFFIPGFRAPTSLWDLSPHQGLNLGPSSESLEL